MLKDDTAPVACPQFLYQPLGRWHLDYVPHFHSSPIFFLTAWAVCSLSCSPPLHGNRRGCNNCKEKGSSCSPDCSHNGGVAKMRPHRLLRQNRVLLRASTWTVLHFTSLIPVPQRLSLSCTVLTAALDRSFPPFTVPCLSHKSPGNTEAVW